MNLSRYNEFLSGTGVNLKIVRYYYYGMSEHVLRSKIYVKSSVFTPGNFAIPVNCDGMRGAQRRKR